jgi:hypothetical protein
MAPVLRERREHRKQMRVSNRRLLVLFRRERRLLSAQARIGGERGVALRAPPAEFEEYEKRAIRVAAIGC